MTAEELYQKYRGYRVILNGNLIRGNSEGIVVGYKNDTIPPQLIFAVTSGEERGWNNLDDTVDIIVKHINNSIGYRYALEKNVVKFKFGRR